MGDKDKKWVSSLWIFPLAVWQKHEGRPCAKALLWEERKDADFMAALREAVDKKEIETPLSMENIQQNIWLRENTGKNFSEMPECCWEECDREKYLSPCYLKPLSIAHNRSRMTGKDCSGRFLCQKTKIAVRAILGVFIRSLSGGVLFSKRSRCFSHFLFAVNCSDFC